MSQAVQVVSAWGFATAPLSRIQLRAHLENLSSQRVAERAGFLREGVLRRGFEAHGEAHDAVMFSKVR
jgi:RimJ/RimL family protein N-acetyltransferase